MTTSSARSEQALARWCRAMNPDAGPTRVLVFAAHPDDDVLGVGGRLQSLADAVHVVYVSDGAPLAPRFYRSLGFTRRGDYARARREEARAALLLAGIDERRIHELGAIDQAVAEELVPLTRRACELLRRVAPDVVLSHAYEGGHPDHDASAFAVHAALYTLARSQTGVPTLLEFASYHERDGELVFGRFARDPAHVVPVELAPEARRLKQRMLGCHATQADVWRAFPLDREEFRVAPRYDFSRAPATPFHYDRVDWGVSGRDFLGFTKRALGALGIEGAC